MDITATYDPVKKVFLTTSSDIAQRTAVRNWANCYVGSTPLLYRVFNPLMKATQHYAEYSLLVTLSNQIDTALRNVFGSDYKNVELVVGEGSSLQLGIEFRSFTVTLGVQKDGS